MPKSLLKDDRLKCSKIIISDPPVDTAADANTSVTFEFHEVYRDEAGKVVFTKRVDDLVLMGAPLATHPLYGYVRSVLGATAYGQPLPLPPEFTHEELDAWVNPFIPPAPEPPAEG
jgi:hypothetical protein